MLLPLVLFPPSLSRATAEAGQPGGYLRAGLGAREAAMGNAGVAAVQGPDSIYWNPAGLAFSRRPALASTVSLLSLNRTFNTAEMVLAWDPQAQASAPGTFPMAMNRGVGAWGVGWMSFSLGDDFEGRVSDTASFYSFSDRQDAYLLSHGRALLPWLALGATLKVYERVIERYTAQGVGGDVGALILLGPQVRLGLTASDLGGVLHWSTGYEEPFPNTLRASLSGSWWNERLTLAGQMESVEGRDVDFGAGLEIRVLTYFSGRLGMQKDGATFGGGMALPLGHIQGKFDYAYLPDPLDQGAAQKISLEIYF